MTGISTATIRSDVVSEIAQFTPNCFANLTSASIDALVGDHGSCSMALKAIPNSLQERPTPEGHQFRIEGDLTVVREGEPDLVFDVTVMGEHDGETVGFTSIGLTH
jgi:hypothetical protein